MHVVEINGFHLTYRPTAPLGNARGFIRQRDFLLVRVVCDNGLVGWGEAFGSIWGAAAVIRKQFAPLVLGRSPHQRGAIYASMLDLLGYDKRGCGMMGISALDLALHDLAAKAHGVSVADLLGGALRDRVLTYASGPFMSEGADPFADFEEHAEAYLAKGFKALKPRGGASPRRDAAMVQALRKAVGPDVGLMVDINQGYTCASARDAAALMEGQDLLWIEEPVGPEDLAGYRAVSQTSRIAIAGGEALASTAAFKEFFSAGALSIVQPDLGVCGGFTGFQRVAALAGAFDLPVMPHAFGTAVNLFASLQMARLLPGKHGGGPARYPFVEYDPTGNPLVDLFGFPVDADGHTSSPDLPGLGFELTPDMLEPWIADHWSITR